MKKSVNYRTAAARVERVPPQCLCAEKWTDLRMWNDFVAICS